MTIKILFLCLILSRNKLVVVLSPNAMFTNDNNNGDKSVIIVLPVVYQPVVTVGLIAEQSLTLKARSCL